MFVIWARVCRCTFSIFVNFYETLIWRLHIHKHTESDRLDQYITNIITFMHFYSFKQNYKENLKNQNQNQSISRNENNLVISKYHTNIHKKIILSSKLVSAFSPHQYTYDRKISIYYYKKERILVSIFTFHIPLSPYVSSLYQRY